jgi:hypothetical protein
MLTRDEFRSLSQLLARLAAGGDRAVTVAEYFEASLGQDHLRVAASGDEKPEPRQNQSRRSRTSA